MNTEAIKELLYKMADDALIIGHRNSEWTGIGPVIEEDIAFSSMSQDKIGHAFALYTILHDVLGEGDPDTIGFLREEGQYKNCQLCELPIGEYDFSLVRHFMFDLAEYCRYGMLKGSKFEPLAQLARKVKGEVKYHVMHAHGWMKSLGEGTEESKSRIQTAINEVYPYALGIFEAGPFENVLIEEGVFEGEEALKVLWHNELNVLLKECGFSIPSQSEPILGGRNGFHTEHLKQLLDEMSEVTRMDPKAVW